MFRYQVHIKLNTDFFNKESTCYRFYRKKQTTFAASLDNLSIKLPQVMISMFVGKKTNLFLCHRAKEPMHNKAI